MASASFLATHVCLSSRNISFRKATNGCYFFQKYSSIGQVLCRQVVRPCMVLDTGVVQGVATAVLGITAGIAFLVWTEKQGERGLQRENLQPCVVCKGNKRLDCIRCRGSGRSLSEPSEVCSFCDGVGTIMCTNCAGKGTQPRYLDRYSPEDFMD